MQSSPIIAFKLASLCNKIKHPFVQEKFFPILHIEFVPLAKIVSLSATFFEDSMIIFALSPQTILLFLNLIQGFFIVIIEFFPLKRILSPLI